MLLVVILLAVLLYCSVEFKVDLKNHGFDSSNFLLSFLILVLFWIIGVVVYFILTLFLTGMFGTEVQEELEVEGTTETYIDQNTDERHVNIIATNGFEYKFNMRETIVNVDKSLEKDTIMINYKEPEGNVLQWLILPDFRWVNIDNGAIINVREELK